MKIGFVHLVGGMGAGIRCSAIGTHLRKSGFEVLDIELREEASSKDSFPKYLTFENMRSFFKKVLGKGENSLVVEIGWNHELRKLRNAIPTWYRKLLGLSKEIDVFHAETCVPAYVCALVKEKTKKPFIFDMHGLQAQEAKFRGESLSRINFLEEVERVTVDRADLVVVMSRAMRNFVADNYGTPPDRFIVIPNGSTPYPTRARYDKPLRVVYGGIIDYYERVEDFVAAGQILQGGDYQFVMMGDGRLRNKVLDDINNNRVDIIYIGRKSREESLKRFSQMQVGVAPSTKDITRRVASPIKVLDYAACGLPVVTVDVGEWSDLVSKHDAGIVVAKSDAKEFATAIEQLSDKSLWMQKSSNAVRMVQEECLWEKVLQPLVELYRKWP